MKSITVVVSADDAGGLLPGQLYRVRSVSNTAPQPALVEMDAVEECQHLEAEKVYKTKELIENLRNALDNGYDELGETDIGELLLVENVSVETAEKDDPCNSNKPI
jgi:hypothetical protein